jgi:GT2 family glycosyltransferase
MIPDITYLVMDYNPSDNQAAADAFRDMEYSFDNLDPSISKDVILISQGNSAYREGFLGFIAHERGWQFLALPKNVGISRGINIGLRLARTPYLGVISSDVIITQGMDTALLSEFKADTLAVIPRSNKSEIPYQQFIPKCNFGEANVDLTDAPPSQSVIAYELSVLFLKTDARNAIGYFDERWKACYENLDYGLRTYLAGYKTIMSNKGFAWHHHGGCIKSGARNQTYADYIDMPNGFDQSKLVPLWEAKWPGLSRVIDLYKPDQEHNFRLHDIYQRNIFLGADQDVGY